MHRAGARSRSCKRTQHTGASKPSLMARLLDLCREGASGGASSHEKALQRCKLLSGVTCTCSSTHTPRTTSSRHTTHVRLPYRRYGLWKEEESATSRLLAAKLLCPQNDGRSILWASEVNPEVRWRLASLVHSFHTHAEPLPATNVHFQRPRSSHPSRQPPSHHWKIGLKEAQPEN